MGAESSVVTPTTPMVCSSQIDGGAGETNLFHSFDVFLYPLWW